MELKPGYKQTEVGVIPEDWEVNKLEKDISLISGHHVLARYCNSNGEGLPYITGPADFPNGVIQHSKFTIKPTTMCRANDILLTVKGSGAGTLVLSDTQYCISRQLMAIRTSNWNTRFIYYLLKQDESLFGSTATGLIPGLSRGDILNKTIITPSLAEQTAIANALSDADALIQSLTRLIAKKRQIKQGAMQTLLNPYENGRLKAGWLVKKLGEIFEITAGGDLRKNEFSKTADENYQYPIYSNALTNCGLYGYCKSFDYSGSFITVTARGSVGFAVTRNCAFAAIGRLLVLKPINDINCQFVSEYINLRVEFANENTGVPQLTAPQISNYEIAFPSKNSEQTRITTILSDMDAEIATLETKLAKYQRIKQGMMQNLLTGRIRLVKPESKTGAAA